MRCGIPTPISNLHDLIFNFNYAAGHLWFVYMLIGIYLLIPMLSPWAEQVSRRQLLFFLAIWVFTNIFPILRDWLDPNNLALSYGPTGIPRDLWGIGTEGQMGVWTTPVQIVLTALITFCTTAVVCTLLQRIPKVGKYIMG